MTPEQRPSTVQGRLTCDGSDMADDLHELIARLEAIEVRAAHQELAIADLNEIVTQQWNRIAALDRQLMTTREELQNMSTEPHPGNQPPPHY